MLLVEIQLSNNAQNDWRPHLNYLADLTFTRLAVCKQRCNCYLTSNFCSYFIQVYLELIELLVTCMPVFDTIRELRNGKMYETATNTNIREDNSSETNLIKSAHECNTDNESKTRNSIQEVDEQMKNFITV